MAPPCVVFTVVVYITIDDVLSAVFDALDIPCAGVVADPVLLSVVLVLVCETLFAF